MEEELTKIAEQSFLKTMRNYSYFADVSIALQRIQTELREINKRSKAVERDIGIPIFPPPKPGEKKKPLHSAPERKFLSGTELEKIRLRKHLKISQMAALLKVSHRKYVEWERGHYLMAPWVEEEILRISKIHTRELQALFKKKETKSAYRPAKLSLKKTRGIPLKIITRDDINRVCRGLKISQRQLSEQLSIPYHKLQNWIDKQSHPSDEIIKKVIDMLESIKDTVPETPEQSRQAGQDNDPKRVKPEEIRAMRDTLHWTRRELAIYLGMNESLIYYWEKGFANPTPPFMEKLRSLREKIKTREIVPEYEGPLATVEEVLFLQKKLNWYANGVAKELHIGLSRLRDLYAGRAKITYSDTIKIRNLQKKIMMGEIKPHIEQKKIPGPLIREICTAYRINQIELSEKVGCSCDMISVWISGRRIPCPEFNARLWDLWNNAPKNMPGIVTPEEIYQIRRALGMSQIQFARNLGVKSGAVSNWEQGKTKPTLLRSDKIRAIFKGIQHSTASEVIK